MCYWWGWVPTCGLTAILSASAITQWYLPDVPVPPLAIGLVLSIGASATSLEQIFSVGGAGMKADVAKTVGVVIFQAALLINQLAQLDVARARRRRRRIRAREKGRVAAAGAER